MAMNTETKLVYISFNPNSDSGIYHEIYDESMRDYLDAQSDRKFLCEVVVPSTDKTTIMNLGVAQIDKELADLHVQMEHKKAKKQQLLAIEHNEGNK